MTAARSLVVLGAAGLVGGWVLRSLAGAGDRVTTVDLAGRVDLVADVTEPGEEVRAAVAAADTVVLALPEQTAAHCLDWIARTAAARTVIVTTCSVQGPVFDRARELGAGQLVLGVNPMFSPTLDSAGRPVVVVARQPDGPEVELVRARLADGGMTVSVMGPEEHDTAMSLLQTLPHAAVLAFATALPEQRVDVAALMRIAPPPARMLIALACRILTAPPEVYWDIQGANPQSAPRRAELLRSLGRLDTLVADGDEAGFRAALAAAADWLGPYTATGAQECHRLFDQLRTAPADDRPGGGAPAGPPGVSA
ncbi:prephenate dehydrogenase dimerization domain-containing protein [Streptomyces sp. NPDC047017]|uniref:prephenate dehydrogenase dimerization domain-containing protein n=1 Tax=Streptomyces sp. NPDC047017 TaxID=3155024 RepID=UPI00340081D2